MDKKKSSGVIRRENIIEITVNNKIQWINFVLRFFVLCHINVFESTLSL